MNASTKAIQSKLSAFPKEKDRIIAQKFLDKRDFNSLLQIIHSVIYKELAKNEEEENDVLSNLYSLEMEVDRYVEPLDLEDSYIDDIYF